jgi:hypothetical protein
MVNSITKTSYPNIFGPNANYAILAETGIAGIGHTITVNNGVYGNNGGAGQITGTYNGTGSADQTHVAAAKTNLDQLRTAINALTGTVITYNGGTLTFNPSNPVSGTGDLYKGAAATDIVNTGATLTFDGKGNPDSQFFIISQQAITFSNTTFSFINNALAANVFFVSSTAITFATTTNVPGVLLAGTQVTFDSASNIIDGNIFAEGTNVTFAANTTVNAPTVCYLKGTKILTEKGFVNVEDLNIGDKVVSKGKILDNHCIDVDSGFSLEPVTWIGNFKETNLSEYNLPICIKAHALGENMPFEDLHVSPGHRVLFDGRLVMAKNLVNGVTIFQDSDFDSVEYYHFELKNHSSVVANGVLSESFLDLDMRKVFKSEKSEVLLNESAYLDSLVAV